MDIIDEYKQDIVNRLLGIIGVNLDNLPVAVQAKTFNDQQIINKFKELIPVVRRFYSSDKNTALHSNAFEKQKNPALNLIRQLLREHNYEVKTQIRVSEITHVKEKLYIIRKPNDVIDDSLKVSQIIRHKIAPVITKKNKGA